MEEEIRGFVTRIIYRNEENTYTVFELSTGEEHITCTGFVLTISVGEPCAVRGQYTEHPTYGRQFKAGSCHEVAPEGADAILRYLSGGRIRGIGKGLAKRIVEKFGDDTFRIMDEEPERLAEVKGISASGAQEIAAQIQALRDTREAEVFLQQYGITNKQAAKIMKFYGERLYGVLKENPYQLAEDIRGIGFATADEIASRVGIRPDAEFRIRSGVLFALNEAMGEGSSYQTRERLVERACTLLQVSPELVELQIDNLAMERRLRICKKGEETQVFSQQAYRTEQRIARMLLDLSVAQPEGAPEDGEDLEGEIRALERKEGIELDELQREAVRDAAQSTVLILSGGPGTGKTTTINTIIRYFLSKQMDILLAAPTGRAAKRMTEATGYEAMTIHRLLGVHARSDDEESGGLQPQYSIYEKDADNPLEAGALIVDEMSMVDMFLFQSLLRAVLPGTHLVLVGDQDQLPSVGPGRVLQDLIASGAFKTVILRHVFRQASQSDIIMNAHHILEGEPMKLDNRSRDFFFLERDSVPVIYKHTVQLLTQMLPSYVHCTREEIQVLTPMRKGTLGVVKLNEVLQQVLNPPSEKKTEYTAHEVTFREGDKVMQTRNNYQMEWEVRGKHGFAVDSGQGIFNGDFGHIRRIDPAAREMEIGFDEGRIVRYPFSDLDDLDLAYAVTVHKSQGSEYPAVIMPLLSGPPALFNRNLLYTAITRARGCVTILGSRECVERMAANVRTSRRCTGLEDRIREMQALDADRQELEEAEDLLPWEEPGQERTQRLPEEHSEREDEKWEDGDEEEDGTLPWD